MKTKICYILSDINKALAFEWIVEKLDQKKYELHFILMNRTSETTIQNFLKEKNVPFLYIHYLGKKDLFNSLFKIYRYLKTNTIEVVHCHLFDACAAGLTAARFAGIKRRIFTRHYSTFHHQYFPRAVWYDRFLNFMATDIIAISENVKIVLEKKEKVNPEKITLVHHGFDLKAFKQSDPEKVKVLKQKYHTEGKYPVIGVISRYFELKGIQYMIPAFSKLLEKYPQSHLILANATGNYTKEIKNLLQTLPANSYTEVIFEEDLFSLYHLFDIFVHVPINREIEAFGQTYIEALASGIPSVFTLSGVASEFIINRQNALVVDFQDSEEIYTAISEIWNDKELRGNLIKNGYQSVNKGFSLDQMIFKLESIYSK